MHRHLGARIGQALESLERGRERPAAEGGPTGQTTARALLRTAPAR
ncbi:hypothetical protein JQN58_33610 [Aneurinibacillus sp. BA2021]|nr:hypothetical protein [Aneurinibacillus sp. BA2021]